MTLITRAHSESEKLKGSAITYRAGMGSKYATCPDSCHLKPETTEPVKVDSVYAETVARSVPAGGTSYLYTHFHPIDWPELANSYGCTTYNYSCDTLRDAADSTLQGVPSVANIPLEDWERIAVKNSAAIETSKGPSIMALRCQNETTGVSCGNCGDRLGPWCARPERSFVVVFTNHGSARKLAGDLTKKGGCYGSGGNVRMHWDRLSKQDQIETDSETVTRFVASLNYGSLLRHHIVGDIGTTEYS